MPQAKTLVRSIEVLFSMAIRGNPGRKETRQINDENDYQRRHGRLLANKAPPSLTPGASPPPPRFFYPSSSELQRIPHNRRLSKWPSSMADAGVQKCVPNV